MGQYSKEAIKYFLKNQCQLFDELVAETEEDAAEFLDECMAVELDNIKDVRDYLDKMGMDVEGMTEAELKDASEVFALPNGKFLIVEC